LATNLQGKLEEGEGELRREGGEAENKKCRESETHHLTSMAIFLWYFMRLAPLPTHISSNCVHRHHVVVPLRQPSFFMISFSSAISNHHVSLASHRQLYNIPSELTHFLKMSHGSGSSQMLFGKTTSQNL
jgi:hypothetical protein